MATFNDTFVSENDPLNIDLANHTSNSGHPWAAHATATTSEQQELIGTQDIVSPKGQTSTTRIGNYINVTPNSADQTLDCDIYWTGAFFTGSGYSNMLIAVRCSGTVQTGYFLSIDTRQSWTRLSIQHRVDGALIGYIGDPNIVDILDPDRQNLQRVRLAVSGTGATVSLSSFYDLGAGWVTAVTGDDTSAERIVDANFAGGLGFRYSVCGPLSCAFHIDAMRTEQVGSAGGIVPLAQANQRVL